MLYFWGGVGVCSELNDRIKVICCSLWRDVSDAFISNYVCVHFLATPQYVLDPDYVEAAEGESPSIHFTVTSDPPLAEDAKHVLTCKNGDAATKRFRIEGSCITFRNVRLGDSGVYTISCRDEAGLEGKETLELDITRANHPTAGCCKSGESN